MFNQVDKVKSLSVLCWIWMQTFQ